MTHLHLTEQERKEFQSKENERLLHILKVVYKVDEHIIDEFRSIFKRTC
ncbi:MAG: hypothetical protein [Arizlama microvirus]|nr:MAG: hypothetical protein [Arizlama microvirus]